MPPGNGYQGICDKCGEVGHKWRECPKSAWVQWMQAEGEKEEGAKDNTGGAVELPNARADAIEVERDSWDLMNVKTTNYWKPLESKEEEECLDEWEEEADLRCGI